MPLDGFGPAWEAVLALPLSEELDCDRSAVRIFMNSLLIIDSTTANIFLADQVTEMVIFWVSSDKVAYREVLR